ncbi:14861_t:CDS:2, partial [Gigaspora rosea]
IESIEAYPSGRPQSLRSDSQGMQKVKKVYTMNIMIEKSIESVEAYPSGRPQSLRSDSQDM